MLSYDELLKYITKQCILHNGNAFEIDSSGLLSLNFFWSEHYCAKKKLFDYCWVYERTERYDECETAERILSELPKGITYIKDTSVISKLPDITKYKYDGYNDRFNVASVLYETRFKILVSELYAKKVVSVSNGSKVIIIGNFDKKTIDDALDFKKIILSSHSEIIEPLFQNGLQRLFGSCYLSNTGLADNEGRGYRLQYVNMKPLSYEYQRLGLTIAIAEYGATFLKQDELYFIDRYIDHSESAQNKITITKMKCYSKKELKDW